ncbi:MAG: acyltransferase [Propionibacteriaceae bacterium]|nr:acyltransferase [Propionibacteriaceae bacterium]
MATPVISGDFRPPADPVAVRRPRSVGIDLVRVLGLLGVVAGHTVDTDNYLWFHHLMVIWDVPVFFVISGYLWNPNRGWVDEFRRRSRKLLVPYAVWMTISVLICVIFLLPDRPVLTPPEGSPLLPLPSQPKGSVLYQAVMGGDYMQEFFAPLWFVTAMWAALMIMRAAIKVHPLLPWVIGIGGVAWATYSRETIVILPEDIGMGLVAVFLLCVGMALRTYRAWFKYPLPAGVVLAGVPLLAAGYGLIDEIHPKGAFMGTPGWSILASAAISIGLILIGEGLQAHIPAVVGTSITTIASCGYVIFIGHCVLRELYTRIFDFRANGMWMFLACFFGSLALGLIVRKTPLKSYLL